MLVHPFQYAFIALLDGSSKFGCGKEVHEFGLVHAVADERDDAAVLGADEREACFFERFAVDAIFGRFPFFELSANADPLVLVDVVFLFDAVEQQVLAVLFDVAKGCVYHAGKYRIVCF